MEEERKPLSRRARALIIAAVVLFMIAGLLYDSNFRLETEEIELICEGLPESFNGLRVVQLSDLHGREFGKNNEKLVNAVRAARPDVIFLTGDFIEEAEDIAVTETLVGQLSGLAPMYFISGNHDWAGGNIEALAAVLKDSGVNYLRNDYDVFVRGGQSVIIAGVEDPNSLADMRKPDELVDIINTNFPDSFKILLGHRNYWVDEYPDLQVNIIYSGHAHGGIIRLPLLGGLIGTNKELFPKYDAGVFTSGEYYMVVSRGFAPAAHIPRVLNNPQILVTTLYCG